MNISLHASSYCIYAWMLHACGATLYRLFSRSLLCLIWDLPRTLRLRRGGGEASLREDVKKVALPLLCHVRCKTFFLPYAAHAHGEGPRGVAEQQSFRRRILFFQAVVADLRDAGAHPQPRVLFSQYCKTIRVVREQHRTNDSPSKKKKPTTPRNGGRRLHMTNRAGRGGAGLDPPPARGPILEEPIL